MVRQQRSDCRGLGRPGTCLCSRKPAAVGRALRPWGTSTGKKCLLSPAIAPVSATATATATALPPALERRQPAKRAIAAAPSSTVVRISELPAKVAGPVLTTVIELASGTNLSATLCARVLATPRVVDVKVQGTKLYVLQAKPSQVRTSLDFIGSTRGFKARQNRAGKRCPVKQRVNRRRRRLIRTKNERHIRA